MTGNDHHESVDSGGIRRRRSSQHDEDNLPDGHQVEDSPQAGGARTDSPPLPPTLTTSGPIPRVRFSADLKRNQPVNTPPPSVQHQPPSVGALPSFAGPRT